MSFIPGQPVTAVVQRIEIMKLRHGDNLILGFSIGGGIDQDPGQNPFSEDKTDKGIYVTRITPGGPAHDAGLRMGDKIMQVNGWDMTVVTHDKARKRLTKKDEDVVRLLVTRKSLEQAVKQSMGGCPQTVT
uniref:Tax1-binding protein 3 n=1 Tax=Labrus bergylta TaxID=56723 RepID=A0A3Q3EQ34_9LABR|nr:tax1-binding protein 3 [Labrus bergylta]